MLRDDRREDQTRDKRERGRRRKDTGARETSVREGVNENSRDLQEPPGISTDLLDRPETS